MTEIDPIVPVGPTPDPKTPLESKTIVTCLVGIVTFLAVVGYKWKGTNEDLQKMADALVILIPVASLALAALFRKTGGGQIVNKEQKATIMAVKRASRRTAAMGIHNPPTTTPSRSSYPPGTPSLLWIACGMAILLFTGTGCMSRVEYTTFREGLNQVDQPILEEHKAWAEALANDPKKLPNLFDGETPEDRAAWLEAREAWHRERQQFMDNAKLNDAK